MVNVLVIVAKSKVAQHVTIHYANNEDRYSVSEDLLSRRKPLEPTCCVGTIIVAQLWCVRNKLLSLVGRETF